MFLKKISPIFSSVAFLLLALSFGPTTSAAEPNLIQNPSFQKAGSGGLPANWTTVYQGTPAPTFKYPVSGSTGGKAAEVIYSKAPSGKAYWSPDQVDVAYGETYSFVNWYKSNVATDIVAEFQDINGGVSELVVKSLSSSKNAWKKSSASIDIPAGIVKMRVYHSISKKGNLTVDAFSLKKTGGTLPPTNPSPVIVDLSISASSINASESATLSWTSSNASTCMASGSWSGSKSLNGSENISPSSSSTYTLTCNGAGAATSDSVTLDVKPPIVPPSSKGMVTFSFDDSWISQYTVALPILEKAGIKGTFYITTEPIQKAWDDFMVPSQVKEIANKGHEIGDHTTTHPHLTKLSQSNITKEVTDSKKYLENLIGTSVTTFAYPYGEFNATVKNAVKSAGYLSARGINDGLNKNTSDKYNLLSPCILKSTPFSEIKESIDNAISNDGWYILCFHEIRPDGDEYSLTESQFQQIVDYVKSVGVKTVTIKEGFDSLWN